MKIKTYSVPSGRHWAFRLLLSVLPLVCLFSGLAQDASIGVSPAPDAPKPLPPLESLKRVVLPDGFEMALMASEPQIQDPSGIAFDEWGRLFVCELHGYNIEGHLDVQELNKTGKLDTQVRRVRWEFMGGKIAEEAAKRQFGVVKLLSDRDEDGIMDHAEVWADDLPPCYGLIPARGGIIAVCAPDIVFLADRDHDGKVDFRETLFSGFRVRTLERGINNPRWGFDNWIYVGGAGDGGTITGPYLQEAVTLGSTDFRIKADGTAIEPVTGRVGTFGMTMNEVGDRFPSSGGTPVVCALPIGYHYLKRNPYVASPGMNYSASNYNQGFRISQPHPWRVRRQQDPEWVKFYGAHETNSNYFSGGCSAEFYSEGALPSQFSGSVFYCEPSLNIIHRSIVSRVGNRYQARRARGEERSEFLASTDQWFRPMSLRFGPDGNLFIVDMYREIIEDYSAIPRFLQQQYGLNRGSDRGRLWRLAPIARRFRDSGGLQGTAARLSARKLVEWTQSSVVWRRLTAQRLLVERQESSVAPDLRSKIRQDESAAGCLMALYTLSELGLLEEQSLRLALSSRFYEVRVHGLQLAEASLDHPGIRSQVLGMVRDSDSRVRLQLALSLGEMDGIFAAEVLLDLLRSHSSDEWMGVAVLSSSREMAPALLDGLLRSVAPQDEEIISLIRPLAATIAGSGKGSELRDVLALVFRKKPALQSRVLEGVLDVVSKSPGPLVAEDWAVLDPYLKGQFEGRVVELATKVRVCLSGPDQAILRSLFQRALQQASDAELPEERRLQALRILESAPFELIAGLRAELLHPTQSPAIQRGVLRCLSASSSDRVGVEILSGWDGYSPELRATVLDVVFSRENRLRSLVESLERGEVSIGELSMRQRERLTESLDPVLAKRMALVVASTESHRASSDRLEAFRTALRAVGDFERGRFVFDRLCSSCHQVKGRGFDVGPSLVSLSGKPDEALLLEILNPSNKIDPEYLLYTAETESGETLSGLLAVDSPTSVTLRAAQGLDHVILRRDIRSLRSSALSLMPDNFSELLTPQQLNDLLVFLRRSYSE